MHRLKMAVSSPSAGNHSGGRKFLSRLQGVFGENFTSSSSSSLTRDNIHVSLHGHSSSGGCRTHLEKRHVEKCFKAIEKVTKLCKQPKMELKNSPPYLLDILPETYNYIQGICGEYNNDYSKLNELEYFIMFIDIFTHRLRQTLKLFKDGKDKIFDENSEYRNRLTMLSLVFSHMLKDLQALFPDHRFNISSFQITKPDAASFWMNNFEGKAIVPWLEFRTALSAVHPIENQAELLALKYTIDLTCNDHVSIYEFDIFIRLFQPWHNILQNWKALAVTHPGYGAFLTYDEVMTKLQKHIHLAGSYIYRQSCTKLGQWAIGYVTDQRQILQTIIQNKSLAQALVDGARNGFYLYPDGNLVNPDISELVEESPVSRIRVTQEQYEVYCQNNNSFQTCKICLANEKDLQIEPCGHLICTVCFNRMSENDTGNLSCPFCRGEIKSTQPVVIDPFEPTSCPTGTLTLLSRQTSNPTRMQNPPPRPPRMAGSPATSPNTTRRTVQNPPGTLVNGETAFSYSEATNCPIVQRPVSQGSNSESNPNYAQLEFDKSSSSSSSPRASPFLVPATSAPLTVSPASNSINSNSPLVRQLVSEGYTEEEARIALEVLHNDLNLSRDVLRLFTLRSSPRTRPYVIMNLEESS